MADSDPERTKRITEWLLYVCVRCRECNKQRIDHQDFSYRNNTLIALHNECKEFVPPDNLDYVEWLAKKRKLI